ncbi:sigma-70 family RNA polymerase sigma factor [Streptomyces sp. PSKA54]|uniref:Sigma-70 family RNA polymerase sigma factor n=1 Tax=Streptomyces himalayensis subsp. aureolus TaxID=2758039 RepID=A0A7W2D150_9ACTN|nr:sigma-70 family RNA polymerase sigma factor [Streptomyces himalayensis]MBA4862776.1 sigma-70 family RNA polymerase sigma factor [Streptomyces himalayensis subsp. aureolus]
MATDMHPAHADGADEEPDGERDRWQRMWSHREQLLKVARRRSLSPEDAEDAVHEAMLRAAERPDLDDERLGAWLTTVTMRLCIDRHRQVNREAEVRTSPTLVTPGPVPVEEAVCDRAEARWLAVRSNELPARQAEAIWLKSEDLDVGQVAVKMGLSYRTVESLLARARRTLRNSLAATLGVVLFLVGRGRPRAGGHVQAVAAASTAATLAVAGFVLPYAHHGDGHGTAPRPSVSDTAQTTEVSGTGADGRTPAPARDLPGTQAVGGTEGAGSAGDESLLPLPVPEVSLSGVPAVSVEPLPTLSAPDLTEVAQVPSVPEVPQVPGVPDATEVPSVPGVEVPDATVTPNASALVDTTSTQNAPADDLPGPLPR